MLWDGDCTASCVGIVAWALRLRARRPQAWHAGRHTIADAHVTGSTVNIEGLIHG
jgi:hypothetical protein